LTNPVWLSTLRTGAFSVVEVTVPSPVIVTTMSFPVCQEFQFRTVSDVEVLSACGPAPGDSRLLARVMLLQGDISIAQS